MRMLCGDQCGDQMILTVPQSSDSARVLRVHYYVPYTEAFFRVSNGNGGGNLDEEERKCGMLPKSIIMPILLMEALSI